VASVRSAGGVGFPIDTRRDSDQRAAILPVSVPVVRHRPVTPSLFAITQATCWERIA